MKDISKMLSVATEIVKEFINSRSHEDNTFNLFQILIKKDEVNHSAFIAELLNPNGSHDKGSVFLKIFIEQIRKYYPHHKIDLDHLQSEVSTELYIGRENENAPKGFIDIFINDLQNAIVIENKLDAKDQDKQLFKYNEFCKARNYKNHTILYLTIDGKKASKESERGLAKGKDYLCLSYQKHLLSWLNECITKCNDNISLENAIRQYRSHIEKSINKFKEMEELTPIIEQNLCGAEAIKANYDSVLNQISDALKDNVKEKLDEKLSKYTGTTIIIPEDQGKKNNERFSSIYIDNLFENRIIIESFNTKGFHFESELFIAELTGTNSWHKNKNLSSINL